MSSINLRDLWRRYDTNEGYYFGVNNIQEKAVFIKSILDAYFKERFPTFPISYVTNKDGAKLRAISIEDRVIIIIFRIQIDGHLRVQHANS